MTNYTFSKLPTINTNTTPTSIARSATGSVYDVNDTAFNTPLNMTMVVGGAVVTTISSDALGLLPDFMLADRVKCVWKQAGSSFATVLTTTDVLPGPPGANGPVGKSVTSAAASAGNLVLTLSDGTSLSPVPLPTGSAIDDSSAAYLVGNGAQTKAALSATYAPLSGAPRYVAAPTGIAATDAANISNTITSAVSSGGGTVLLRSGTYNLSSGHLNIPATVTLRGSGNSTVLNGGAYAIINDGVLADVQIGTGWTLYADFLSGHWGTSTSGVAVIGGSAQNVTSARGGTEIWATHALHDMLPRTVAKLRKNLTFKKTSIVILSDSLGTDGSGSGIGWAQLLFDDTYKSAEGTAYNVGNIFGGNNTTITKLTIPGSTPEIDYAYTAYEQAALSVGDGLDNQVKLAESYATYPAAALATADLAIICQGHNGGTTNTIENLVANLRARGTEVMIVTQNPNGTNDPNYARNLWTLREIAASYGCAFADTYSVFLREIYTGRNTAAGLVSADSTHPNQAGWNLYAQTIRNVLLNQRDGSPASAKQPVGRVLAVNTNPSSTEFWGNMAGAQFTPINQSAGVTFTTPSDTVRSPLTGRRLSLTNTLALVPVGEYVEFAPSEAYDVTVYFEQGSVAATAAIKSNAGANTLRTYTVGTSTGTLAATTVDSGTWGAAALSSRPIRIYSTAGTLRVIGVAWSTVGRRYQPRNADGSFRGVTLGGTWAVQAGPWYGVSNIPVTDTAASYAEFDIVGDGFWIKTVKSPSGGVLRVTVDGVKESGVVDTYSTTEYVYTLARTGYGYGRHKVRIAYEYDNGAVVAGGGGTRGARRLALYEIATIDSRMSASQADLTRPADVI